MKVCDLSGSLLDYWVARADGYEYVDVPPDADGKNAGRALLPPGLLESGWKFPPKGPVVNAVRKYSTDWAHGGPIIEREKIYLNWAIDSEKWLATILSLDCDRIFRGVDPEPLIAAMRAYVASKFGDTVPDEITQ